MEWLLDKVHNEQDYNNLTEQEQRRAFQEDEIMQEMSGACYRFLIDSHEEYKGSGFTDAEIFQYLVCGIVDAFTDFMDEKLTIKFSDLLLNVSEYYKKENV